MPRFEKGSDEAKAYMKSIREARKLKTNYEKMKGHEDLIMTNTAEIAVPKTLLYIDGKGEHKIIKTLTKAGTLTRKDKKPVIKIEPKTDHEIKIINNGTTKAGRSKTFLKEIHSNTMDRQGNDNTELNNELSKALHSRKKVDKEKEERLEKARHQHLENAEYSTSFLKNGDFVKKINFKDDKLHAPRKIKKKETKT